MNKEDKMRAIGFLSQSGAFLVTKSGDKVAKYFEFQNIHFILTLTNNRRTSKWVKSIWSINKVGLGA